jgi:hypothetical protein
MAALKMASAAAAEHCRQRYISVSVAE